MSAWGLFFSPVLAAAQPADIAMNTDVPEQVMAADELLDVFGELSALDELAMSQASGGTDTAIDIGNLGANIALNEGTITDVETVNTNTGQIANNVISDNSGITTVFNNTGNGVVFQSSVNVNIFLDPGSR